MKEIKPKDMIVGAVAMVIIFVAAYLYTKYKVDKTPKIDSVQISKTQEIIKKFNYEDSQNKKELKSVDGFEGNGIVIDSTLLTNLGDPENGYFYQAWENNGGKLNSLGKLVLTKSGYLLENMPQDKEIVVSLEKVFDNKIEKKILE